mmetsp:Transcript_10612/g.16196  ORF Transcript_10612/g.16196 Transcript_10612/m.16196 type:complete len:211 (+) Transcript_10612:146-778(+)
MDGRIFQLVRVQLRPRSQVRVLGLLEELWLPGLLGAFFDLFAHFPLLLFNGKFNSIGFVHFAFFVQSHVSTESTVCSGQGALHLGTRVVHVDCDLVEEVLHVGVCQQRRFLPHNFGEPGLEVLKHNLVHPGASELVDLSAFPVEALAFDAAHGLALLLVVLHLESVASLVVLSLGQALEVHRELTDYQVLGEHLGLRDSDEFVELFKVAV